MEDLIPLIILVAISIVGAVLRKNKGKQQGAQPAGTTRKADDLFKFLEQFVDEDTQVPQPVQTQERFTPQQNYVDAQAMPQPEAPVKNKYDKYSGFISPKEKTEMMQKEGISRYQKKVRKITKIAANKQSKSTNRVHIKFDLKSAVIQSEILNRKYE